MEFSLLGFAPALGIFFLLGAKRRSLIPPFGWWLFIVPGAVLFFYGISHSTVPSYETRVEAVGTVYDYVEREIHTGYHHNTIYGFRFAPEDERGGGGPIHLETEIILPHTYNPVDFDGRTLRIIYLNDRERVLKNEAIDIAILSGKDAGFHDSLDARPLGCWLAIPIGAAFAVFGFAGLKHER